MWKYFNSYQILIQYFSLQRMFSDYALARAGTAVVLLTSNGLCHPRRIFKSFLAL